MIESGYWIASDGVRLRTLSSKTVTAAVQQERVVVFVPGWCMPADIWRPNLDALAPPHAVFAMDPRGQGGSDVPDQGYHIDQRADDLQQCIKTFPRVVLVGWSLGGLEVLQLIHRHGEAGVEGVVLVDSTVGEPPEIPPAHAFTMALRSDRRATLELFVRGMFRTIRPEVEIGALLESALRMPLEASLALFPRDLPRSHWRGITRNLRVPLLYAVTPQFAEQAASLQNARPSTQVEVFKEAGHALFVDQPERFNRMLCGFLETLPAVA